MKHFKNLGYAQQAKLYADLMAKQATKQLSKSDAGQLRELRNHLLAIGFNVDADDLVQQGLIYDNRTAVKNYITMCEKYGSDSDRAISPRKKLENVGIICTDFEILKRKLGLFEANKRKRDKENKKSRTGTRHPNSTNSEEVIEGLDIPDQYYQDAASLFGDDEEVIDAYIDGRLLSKDKDLVNRIYDEDDVAGALDQLAVQHGYLDDTKRAAFISGFSHDIFEEE